MSKFVYIATTMVVCYCIYVVSEMIECHSMFPDIANELTEITSCDAFSSQEDLKMYRQRILNITHSHDMFIKCNTMPSTAIKNITLFSIVAYITQTILSDIWRYYN
ncbi:hypothetical protein PPL_01684 [Heterostelium album PN500]|uniref:Uncharacterized protein n=1 Tax=Heterostelium pallidum (strain ATCC 26659 / Pp 5 / PN500) TaxID=670386 RepID=D3B068_HETP5|nr:hypothetical protein PPL_01684 [Heterostelium album PN500]EFA84692.1 hypothetical protein PPL_01684 [Heterostelium album PN500]|eukprot:XP_020436805.1 hypothetical protein PPL_01684 [Heterostelium album PN500]